MSASLERGKLEDARDELKAVREESRRAHQREAPGILVSGVDKLIAKLDRQCEEPIRFNMRNILVGWRRMERRGFKKGMITMAAIWLLFATCVGSCL